MTFKDQNVTLKSLKVEFDAFKEEHKKQLVEMEEKLKCAVKEIAVLKKNENSEETVSELKCESCSFTCNTKQMLKQHISQTHSREHKCKICKVGFKKSSDLEVHIKITHSSTEKFECEQCGKQFFLKWRLTKHQNIHNSETTKKCHYFNNKKNCPFEAIGCMFLHSYAENCRYGKHCKIKMCSFQHNRVVDIFNCNKCDFTCKDETELGSHIDGEHEAWRSTFGFCDYFCRSDHGIHICRSHEDFQKFLGFDIWKTFETDQSDTVFKCLNCDKTSDDDDHMREHINEKHKLEKTSPCNFCDYKDNNWLGLKAHYRSEHFKND